MITKATFLKNFKKHLTIARKLGISKSSILESMKDERCPFILCDDHGCKYSHYSKYFNEHSCWFNHRSYILNVDPTAKKPKNLPKKCPLKDTKSYEKSSEFFEDVDYDMTQDTIPEMIKILKSMEWK